MSHHRILKIHSFPPLNVCFRIILLLISAAILLACSHTEKVLVPPRVSLVSYNAVGVIDFSSNAQKDLSKYVTQNFMQAVQSAQPGVRFLELGNEKQVLAEISHGQFDLQAIRSIGHTYHVDALIFGHFTVSEPTPDIHVSSQLQSLRAGAYVEAMLVTKLWETADGVTMWTNSASRKKRVAGLKADTTGNINFGASDPEATYEQIVPEVVFDNTADFRSYYEYRKVK